LLSKVNSIIPRYPTEFDKTPITELFCNICNCVVKCDKQFLVDSHRRISYTCSKNTLQKLHLIEKHFPEYTFARNYICPNVHFPEKFICQNMHLTENTLPKHALDQIHRKVKISNVHLTEMTFHRNYIFLKYVCQK